MDEKKPDQVQDLEDEQLEGASGGANSSRIGRRTGSIPPIPVILPAESDEPGGSSDSW